MESLKVHEVSIANMMFNVRQTTRHASKYHPVNHILQAMLAMCATAYAVMYFTHQSAKTAAVEVECQNKRA